MSVNHQCPACGTQLKLREESAGRRIRCPQCKEISRVAGVSEVQPPADLALQSATQLPPPAAAAPVTMTPEEVAAQIQDAFRSGQIQPVPVTLFYRLGTALVALLMVLLPLFYMAMILMVALVVYRHASSNWVIVQKASESSRSARAVVGAFGLYASPILAGVTLVFFMLKPFFARASGGTAPRSLKPADEPELFDFVRRICRAVRAPVPQRIDVDCNVNASAMFRRGLLSFAGNDLVLTIGLPLVSGMSVRQFGGVLAHEFGHFSQGAGMRLSFVIRTINYWFQRVVYERDQWDERLEDLSRSLDIRLGWVLYFVRFCVWLTRRVLWCLMLTGDVVSSLMLRQMEFDADRCEARFAGSRTFATTARQLHVLGIAHRWAMSDLETLQADGRLADNYPRLIMANASQLTDRIQSAIDEQIIESRTGLLDSHPCDRERIANAAAEQTNGIFQLEFPASALFREYDRISHKVTWDFYREMLGDSVRRQDLYPVDELLLRLQEQQQGWKALRRFFQDQLTFYRPLATPPKLSVDPGNAREMVRLLSHSREQMRSSREQFAAGWKSYDEYDTWELEACLAENLQQAGLVVAKDEFSRPLPNADAIATLRQEAAEGQIAAVAELETFEKAAAERMRTGLLLAGQSHFRVTLQKAGIQQSEIAVLGSLLVQINASLSTFLQLRNAQIAVARLLAAIDDASDKAKVFGQVQERMKQLVQLLEKVEERFSEIPYPFDHSQRELKVGAYLVCQTPNEEEPGELYSTAEKALENLSHLQRRVMGRICQVVEAVESAVGLDLFPDPVDEDDDDDDDE